MTSSTESDTTMTILEDASSTSGSVRNSIGRSISMSSHGSSTVSSILTDTDTPIPEDMHKHKIYIYSQRCFEDHIHPRIDTCEDVCLYYCRRLKILPTTRLLFGLCVYEAAETWLVPGTQLLPHVRYCFRMRYKVPELDTQLQALDPNAYEYLYYQMRYDMVNENIVEIRYPAKKDNVMGLGVVDMYIDFLEKRDSVEQIEANYKRYLPRPLVRAHKLFVKPKICNSFRQFRGKSFSLSYLRWNYVHQVHNLAPNYLMEMYTAVVDIFPDEVESAARRGLTNGNDTETRVYVKLELLECAKPCLQISRMMAAEKLKWNIVANLDSITALCIEQHNIVRLEITELSNGYRMQFDNETVLESFITYLAGYIRLTSKWTFDLCANYLTPSLQELNQLKCHGPVGGNFSFGKLHEKGDGCGSYIIRQCEKEYDAYFIDINTKRVGHDERKCKTETFKIERDQLNGKWRLHYNSAVVPFDNLVDLAKNIPTDSKRKQRIPPSVFEKPSLLLICLPKNLQSKKTETELSEAELQRRRPQIFAPIHDLLWYRETARDCDNGKMYRMRADWKQEGSFKDVSVTLKVLKYDTDFQDFMKLAHTWSNIYSPQFLKLYGLTLSTPYTMIMEFAEYGPLNEFLQIRKEKIPIEPLYDVVLGLVRGVLYLREQSIVHGFLRCCNLHVTKYNPRDKCGLRVKIADPGFPRNYRSDELPWIPLEYYRNFDGAKQDPYADAWAFATTLWEIFARGQTISNYSAEELTKNYNNHAAILTIPHDWPTSIRDTIMDGWSRDADLRFDHHTIFERLNRLKESASNNYVTNLNEAESVEDLSCSQSALGDLSSDEAFHLHNGHHEFASDGALSNSTTSDLAPLIGVQHHQQHNGHHHNPLAMARHPNTRSYFDETPSVLRIRNGKVIYKKKIGEGHYGTVYLGELLYNAPDRSPEKVAIKTLKTLRATQLNADFMREIKIMQTLDHPNIVKIKEWVQDPISIIMEYVECGCFIVYLTTHKPNLTNNTLLRFALDIALGMDYLRNQNIIHRDLAARNILVDRDRAKISDFGLAQKANSDGYYLAQSAREIPIKWYSPESIRTNKFSFQSDVWSYGVTLFEMFSRGDIPNLDTEREITHEDFLNRLEKGEQLARPELCPENVYISLMKPCWELTPKMRPNFKAIIEKVQSIRNENGEII